MTDTLYKLCAKIELPTAKSVVRGNINSSIFLRWRRPINQKRSSLLEYMKNRIKVILIENHSQLLKQQNSNIHYYGKIVKYRYAQIRLTNLLRLILVSTLKRKLVEYLKLI